jgi:hypothetical protein
VGSKDEVDRVLRFINHEKKITQDKSSFSEKRRKSPIKSRTKEFN